MSWVLGELMEIASWKLLMESLSSWQGGIQALVGLQAKCIQASYTKQYISP